MSKVFPELTERHREFIARQHIFFVASAVADGRVNLSPKGGDTLRTFDARTLAYLDLTGSEIETAAHALHGGRLTVMVCGFEEDPLILRASGRGEVIRPEHAEWAALRERFPPLPGARQIIRVHVESVLTSCGFGVPFFTYQGERPKLVAWTEHKGEEGVRRYWAEHNQRSLDGLASGLVEAWQPTRR